MSTAPIAPEQVDWQTWLRRWDAQQQLHIPEREERFQAIVSAVAGLDMERPRVLDLGCGPGSLSGRLLTRLPQAEIVAIDADPVLLAIGRGAFAAQPNIHFLDADLRGGWAAQLPLSPPYDAAVSTTALHWLGLPDLVRCYRTLAAVLRPGALFLNGDRLDFGADQQRIAELARHVRPEPATRGGDETYDDWWRSAQAEPAFADAVADRARRWHDHPHDDQPQSYEFHQAALHAAGFREVGTLWQQLNNRVLIAVR